MSKTIRLVLAISIFPQILLFRLLKLKPEIIEIYYSNNLYPLISKLSRYALGWLPFSFGDLMYGAGVLYIFNWIYKRSKNGFRYTKIKNYALDVFTAISLVYFMFHMLWGFNYYRLPLDQRLKIDTQYTTTELIKATETIIKKSNAIHFKISNDSLKKITVPYSFKELKEKAAHGYATISESINFLAYEPYSQKQSLYSIPLAYMGFSGYINPFTNEAQINWHTPKNSMPITLVHEQAHQLGYAAENEANFIAFLATENHKDLYFQYAAHSFALQYCLNDLYLKDKDGFNKLKASINGGILKDFEDRTAHWAQFKNPLEPLFKSFYSRFLKANNQTQGIDSYNAVIGLIVNHIHKTQLSIEISLD